MVKKQNNYLDVYLESEKQWKKYKEETPIKYFIFETIPYFYYRALEVLRPINIIRFINYRTFSRYHVVNTKLKPGYYDCDIIIEECLFEILRKFVEEECAWMEYICNEKMYNESSLFIRFKRRFFRFVDPELGLKYLSPWNDIDEEWCENIKVAYLNLVKLRKMEKDGTESDEVLYKLKDSIVKTIIEYRGYMWT